MKESDFICEVCGGELFSNVCQGCQETQYSCDCTRLSREDYQAWLVSKGEVKTNSLTNQEPWAEELEKKTKGALSPFDHLYDPDDDGGPAKYPCGHYHISKQRIKAFISKWLQQEREAEKNEMIYLIMKEATAKRWLLSEEFLKKLVRHKQT